MAPSSSASAPLGNLHSAALRLLYAWRLRALRGLGPDRSLEDLVEFAFSSVRPKIKPWQLPSELLPVLKAVQALQPRTVLEIGTARGGTLFLFSRVAAPDATLISVDLPQGPFGGGYSRSRQLLYQAFALPQQSLELLRADSHAPSTRDEVAARLKGAPLDFLFIDGDHTYDGVKRDYEMYGPLVRKGGLIAFHDIVQTPAAAAHQVARFWEEVKQRHATQEFIEDPAQGRMGLGLVTV
jgi:predicted O-methyltransferase YrrM